MNPETITVSLDAITPETVTPETLAAVVEELRKYNRIAEEAAAQADALKDILKDVMKARNTDEISGTDYRVTWKPVQSSSLDSARIKADFPADVVARYLKTTTTRRFLLK